MSALGLGELLVSVRSDTSHLVKGFKRAESTVSKSARTMTTVIKTLTAAYIGLNAIDLAKSLGKQADEMTNVESKLKLVTKSTEELVNAQSKLFKIAQETRTSYTGTVDLYSNLASSLNEMNKSQKEVLRTTETVNKAIAISGGTTQQAAAAVQQLGQAFASGKLAGDELKSILENSKGLAKAIAEGMSVPIGALKELGAEGKITSEVLFDALTKSADTVDEKFLKFAVTIGGAKTQLENSTLKIIGMFDEMSGASSFVAESIGNISKSIDGMTPENIEETARQVKVVAVTIGVLTVGMKGYTTVTALATAANALYGGSFGSVNRAIILTTASTKALSLATKALPYVVIATAIYTIADAWIGADDAAKKYQDTVDKNSKGFTGQGILADYKYESEIKNLVSAFDTMEAREKAYYATKGTNAEEYYKDLYDKSVLAYREIESVALESSAKIFATIPGVSKDAGDGSVEETGELSKEELDEKLNPMDEANAHIEAYYARQDAENQLTANYVENLIARSEALSESFLTEEELFAAKIEADATLAEELFAAKITNEEERNAMMLEIAKRYEDSLTGLSIQGMSAREKFSSKSSTDQTKQVLGDMANLTSGMATQNKAMFNINKAAALANAAISLPASVMKTFEAYPAPYSFIMGGLAAAAGAAQIATIASSSFGGGGGGSTSVPTSSGGLSTTLGTVPSDIGGGVDTEIATVKEVTISMPDSSMMSTDSVRELIERIQEESGDMGLSLVVAS